MSSSFFVEPEIRWADLDPNFHVLHSKYYDYAAYCRTKLLVSEGLTPEVMTDLHIGPILFRESCIFRKELRFGDRLKVDMMLIMMMKDYSRWRIKHRLFKNNDTLAATIEVDIAWIDAQLRKLIIPPQQVVKAAEAIPRSTDFMFTDKRSDFL